MFTSESVASGHPDKICDSISDAIVDACLTIDPDARVAVETLVKGKAEGSFIILAGEVAKSRATCRKISGSIPQNSDISSGA